MIIQNHEKQIEYNVKHRKKEKPEKQMAEEFIKSFNEEAKKQNSEWIAQMDECEYGEIGKFILLYLRKYKKVGWWIFKETKMMHELQVGCYYPHYSFVDNDYILTDYGKGKNEKIFKLLPQFKSILEAIPQAFFITPIEELTTEKMEKRIKSMENWVEKIKEKVK
jgi:hypothetical protein